MVVELLRVEKDEMDVLLVLAEHECKGLTLRVVEGNDFR
jgi:hypothetical protein